jgi:large subunit ribosomal protein L13
MKTFSAKVHEVSRKWHLIDAAGKTVGSVAEKAAVLLRGKHKPIYTAHVDTGDFVIVINAKKAVFTGQKDIQKQYTSFSGFMGGHKSESPQQRRARRPELIIESAVKGMIPHNCLGRQVYRKLHVYADAEHPHVSQQPVAIAV